MYLIKPNWWPHGRLNMQTPNILPLLLQQTNQEINAHINILDQLIVVHINVANGNRQTKHFLHLELDGGFHLFDLTNHIVSLRQNTWKLTGFVQTWSQQPRDLSDQSVGGQESVVLFGELFDELLVLVELFQVVDGHVGDVVLGGFVDVRLVSEDAHGEFRSSGVWQLDGTGESLVFLRVVVFKHDLDEKRRLKVYVKQCKNTARLPNKAWVRLKTLLF